MELPSLEQVIAIRDIAIKQIEFTRKYTLQLLESVARDQWSVQPAGAPSNLLWQVGHLAVAQYGLLLFRQRGRGEGDLELMPGWLRKQFGKGSDPGGVISIDPNAILDCLDRIHRQALAETANFSAESLIEPIDMPYAVYPIKLGAMLFCPLHESIHAGQIGTIRRMLGYTPIR